MIIVAPRAWVLSHWPRHLVCRCDDEPCCTLKSTPLGTQTTARLRHEVCVPCEQPPPTQTVVLTIVNIQFSRLWGHQTRPPGFRVRIRWKECLHAKLLQCDVLRCPERHDCAEQAQFQVALPDVNRQQQIRWLQRRARRPRRLGHAVSTQLREQGGADLVRRRLTEVPFRTAQEMARDLVPV